MKTELPTTVRDITRKIKGMGFDNALNFLDDNYHRLGHGANSWAYKLNSRTVVKLSSSSHNKTAYDLPDLISDAHRAKYMDRFLPHFKVVVNEEQGYMFAFQKHVKQIRDEDLTDSESNFLGDMKRDLFYTSNKVVHQHPCWKGDGRTILDLHGGNWGVHKNRVVFFDW